MRRRGPEELIGAAATPRGGGKVIKTRVWRALLNERLSFPACAAPFYHRVVSGRWPSGSWSATAGGRRVREPREATVCVSKSQRRGARRGCCAGAVHVRGLQRGGAEARNGRRFGGIGRILAVSGGAWPNLARPARSNAQVGVATAARAPVRTADPTNYELRATATSYARVWEHETARGPRPSRDLTACCTFHWRFTDSTSRR